MLTTKEKLQIRIPALPRPSLAELQKDRSWIVSIEKDISTTEAVVLDLATVLEDGEDYIDGTEYKKRLPEKGLLGYQHMKWLEEHQSAFPELMALLWKVYIDFPGLVAVDADGSRGFPCLDGGGKRWDGGWRWVGRGLRRDGRVGVASNVAIGTMNKQIFSGQECPKCKYQWFSRVEKPKSCPECKTRLKQSKKVASNPRTGTAN